MFFQNKTVIRRIHEVLHGIEKLGDKRFDDYRKRHEAVTVLKSKLHSLIIAEERIVKDFETTLKEIE